MDSASPARSALWQEHLRLGATFAGGSVQSYASERDGSSSGSTFLADVSQVSCLLFSGAPAPGFATAAFAGSVLARGRCAFEAVLTGDGGLASIPLLARTGDSEYLCLDLSERADVLGSWLSFLSSVSDKGVAPYEGMETQDVTGSHVVLALWGRGASHVLEDYLADGVRLPSPGTVTQASLDRIPCILLRPPALDDLTVVFVPPVHAAVLWRSLLSFAEVEPVGMRRVRDELGGRLAWGKAVGTQDRIVMDARELEAHGVMREGAGFVGGRSIRGLA